MTGRITGRWTDHPDVVTAGTWRAEAQWISSLKPCYSVTVLVSIRTPADNERGPRYMEKVFAAIHQTGAGDDAIHSDYGHHAGEVELCCRFPRELRPLILEPLAAKYPACRFAEVKKESEQLRRSHWYAELRLTPELYLILRHTQFEDLLTHNFEDPIEAILKAVQPEGDIESRIEIAIRPAGKVRCWFAKRAVKDRAVNQTRILGWLCCGTTRPPASLSRREDGK